MYLPPRCDASMNIHQIDQMPYADGLNRTARRWSLAKKKKSNFCNCASSMAWALDSQGKSRQRPTRRCGRCGGCIQEAFGLIESDSGEGERWRRGRMQPAPAERAEKEAGRSTPLVFPCVSLALLSRRAVRLPAARRVGPGWAPQSSS